MERNIVTDGVVPSTTLLDQEKYVVGVDGVKTAAQGDFVYGVVRKGRPANECSEITVQGECSAYCTTADGGSITAEDPLTGGQSGMLCKATVGSHQIRAVALENGGADATAIQVLML